MYCLITKDYKNKYDWGICIVRSKVGILIHYNLHFEPLTAKQIADCLQKIMLSIMDGHTYYTITVEARTAESLSSTKFETTDNHISGDELTNLINTKTCYISFEIGNDTFGSAFAYGCITRSNGLTQYMVGQEQTVFILVDLALWEKRKDFLINQIKSICNSSYVTYVAVDKETIVPRSIYSANIRILSNPFIAAGIDPEARIPGIYWAQFLAYSMFSQHDRKSIIGGIDITHTDTLLEDIGTGIWIQTTPNIQTDSRNYQKQVCEMLNIEARSYSIDNDIYHRYLQLQPWLFEKFPLGS